MQAITQTADATAWYSGLPGGQRAKGSPARTDDDADAQIDSALLAQIAAGNPAALEHLYERHSRTAYALACWVVGDTTLAEDVVQEAFLAVWRQAERFDANRGTARSWISTIVRHRGIDAVRRTRSQLVGHEEISDDIVSDGASDVEDGVTVQIEGEGVRRAMLHLPPAQRQAIELAYFQGLSHREIAARLGLPLGTVKGRLRMALQKLRRLLDTELPMAAAAS